MLFKKGDVVTFKPAFLSKADDGKIFLSNDDYSENDKVLGLALQVKVTYADGHKPVMGYQIESVTIASVELGEKQ